MADIAVIATIVVFFLAAAWLTRGLGRVIADSDGGAGQDAAGGSERESSDLELSRGRAE